MGSANKFHPLPRPGIGTESEEKPHPSGNPVGFRGSVQFLPVFFPDLEKPSGSGWKKE
jgi:hypothetical protein